MSKSAIQSLARPSPGGENTVVLSTGIRFAKLISKKFICPKCNIFCGELVPIVDGVTRKWLRKNKKNLFCEELQTKIFCYAGCHNSEHWGWKLFNWSQREIDSITSWPQEWKTDKGALATERIVRQEQDRIKREGK